MSRKSEMEMKSISEDLYHECQAYFKTKQFMAKRIYEQQAEIETLKENLFHTTAKHVEMYDWLNSLNHQISILSKNEGKGNELVESKVKEELNVSCDLANSFNYENEDINKKKLIQSIHDQSFNLNEDEMRSEIIALKKENLMVKKENELLKREISDRNLDITRLKSDKFLLFNELQELINTLKLVKGDDLDKFFKENAKADYNTNKITSSLGIKYNILSAQNQIAYLVHSDILVNKNLNEHLPENKQNTNGRNKNEKNDENVFSLERGINILNKYDSEFDEICKKNIAILQERWSQL